MSVRLAVVAVVSWRIIEGDCIEAMAALDAASVDAVVCDPPYGLEFMGKTWDGPKGFRRAENEADVGRENVFGRTSRTSPESPAAWATGFSKTGYTDGAQRPERPSYGSNRNPCCRSCRKHKRGTDRCVCERPDFDESPADSSRVFQRWCEVWAREALRVLKPGGHLLAFGGTRTSHRMVCAIEDAGFEIRDSIVWLYGSGFPKSLDVSKAIDKAAGAEREVVGEQTGRAIRCVAPLAPRRSAEYDVHVPHAAVKSRYGAARCSCLDDGVGRAAGDDAGRGRGDVGGVPRGVGTVSPPEARTVAVPLNARPGNGPVRELWREDSPQTAGPAPVGAPVLQHGLRGGGSEDAGCGDAALWAGLEGDPTSGAGARQGVPCLRDDAGAERGGAARSPSAPAEGGRDERDGEPSGDVRVVPPHGGSGDGPSAPVDPARDQPRRLVPDDHAGERRAVARVCSWCALPDEGSLGYVASAGTALKPAHEPIVVARKPLAGTVAGNVLAHGTGALNVDGCRVESGQDHRDKCESVVGLDSNRNGAAYGEWKGERESSWSPDGRWPANVVLDPEAAALLDEQTGELHSQDPATRSASRKGGIIFPRPDEPSTAYADSGGASRFFYCPKADSTERHAGLSVMSLFTPADSPDRNDHPTIKPIALMQWLVRLVTPPGGLVLDPFAGSGTTGIAAVLEGFEFVGVEREMQYARIARARLAHWSGAVSEGGA